MDTISDSSDHNRMRFVFQMSRKGEVGIFINIFPLSLKRVGWVCRNQPIFADSVVKCSALIAKRLGDRMTFPKIRRYWHLINCIGAWSAKLLFEVFCPSAEPGMNELSIYTAYSLLNRCSTPVSVTQKLTVIYCYPKQLSIPFIRLSQHPRVQDPS